MTHPTLTPVRAAPLLPTPRSLNADLLRILRARLEIQRDFRVDQLAALGSVTVPAGTQAEDEVLASLESGAVIALREIRQALWRLDEGCFGRCVDCAEPLDLARLAAVPHTTRCLPCGQDRRLD